MHEPSKNFTLRVSPVLMRRVEELAAARGSSWTAAIKAAIVEASMRTGGGSSVPDQREVLELLSEAARAGSVSAMKELLAYHRERRQGRGPDAVDELDELAERRGRTPGSVGGGDR